MEGNAPVSARDEVVNGLSEHACCFSEEDAKRMVDALAHELAEEIRTWVREGGAGAPEYGSSENVSEAADLIDPLKDVT